MTPPRRLLLSPLHSPDVAYDNAASGLAATDVQAAIDEVAASSGGSVVGSPCWFSGATTSLLASGASNSPVWTVNTDGVPAGTDVIVHAADHKQLECVTPGKYLVTFGSAGFETSDAQELGQYVVLNDDSVGPAYNFNSYSQVAWPNNLPTFPLVLVAGDLLKLSMSLSGATTNGDVSQANAVLIRIG